MDKVIAFSVFGDNPRYAVNIVLNAEQALKFYPGWEVRVFYDSTLPAKVVDRLKTFSNVNLIDMENGYTYEFISCQHSSKVFWRFLAYDDKNVDVVIFRDCDSYLTKREADAVEQWLSTNRPIHLMREVQPGHRSKIMAGMWGIRRTKKCKSIMERFIDQAGKRYHNDQGYLNNCIYPLFNPSDRVVNDVDNAFNDKTHDWPSPRINDEFVGKTQGPPGEASGCLDRYNQLIKELL